MTRLQHAPDLRALFPELSVGTLVIEQVDAGPKARDAVAPAVEHLVDRAHAVLATSSEADLEPVRAWRRRSSRSDNSRPGSRSTHSRPASDRLTRVTGSVLST